MRLSDLDIRTIFIEPTNYCNFRCEFCPLRISRRPRQHMDYALLARTVDEIAEHRISEVVAFYLLGEPLLYPHIFKAIRHTRSQGLRAEITTNGSLLTADVTRQLMDAGLRKLTISLQRYGDTDHGERGTPMPFDNYYRRILNAIRELNAAGGRTEVTLMFMSASSKRLFDVDLPMAMRWNRAAFESDLLAIARDVYAAVGIDVSDRQQELRAAVRKLGAHRAFLLRINERTLVGIKPFLDWGSAFTKRPIYTSSFGYCSMAFSSLGILSNGDVTLCCADYDGDTSPGNINDRPLAEILTSERIAAVHRGFQRYRLVDPRCQACFGGPSRLKTAFKTGVQTIVCKTVRPKPGKKLKELYPVRG